MKSRLEIVFREFEGEITAVFIDSLPENYPDELTCYAHVGQHGNCSIEWLYSDTKPVASKNARPLLDELKEIYFPRFILVVSKSGRLPMRKTLRLKELAS